MADLPWPPSLMERSRIRGTGPLGPEERARLFPDRERVLARTRRASLVLMVVVFVIAALLAWAASLLVVLSVVPPSIGERGRLVAWLAVAQFTVLAVLVVVAYLLARMSTRPIEHVFRQEDHVIRAAAHELRNPITRLLVVAEEGLDARRDSAARLRDIIEEAEALGELVDDLAESLRVMAGDIPLVPKRLRLDQVVAVPRSRVRLGEAEMRVEAEPATVTANPRLLRLAMVNLVRNAAQHAYGGGPGVVIVRADRRGVSVIDEGPGMDPAQMAEVLTNPTVAMSRGVGGLGLPFVNWVAEVHGGHLALVNRPEGGLEARLELPVDPSAPVIT